MFGIIKIISLFCRREGGVDIIQLLIIQCPYKEWYFRDRGSVRGEETFWKPFTG